MASPSLYPSWRPLPLATSHDLPALLVSTVFNQDSYVIHVTDLANIWVETMDRKAIYRRSLDEDTSIDPTDNSQNMRAFLSRIRSALDPTHEDHSESRLVLRPASGIGADTDGLTLNITCDIPEMEPLRWPVHLRKCPPSRLANEFVLPLLQVTRSKNEQVDALIEIIQQKDAAMTKLLDKLEATGTRLEHVFTVLSAKQKVSRKVAEEKVKGLAPFKREEWRNPLSAPSDWSGDSGTLLEDLFGERGIPYSSEPDTRIASTLDNWWNTLGDTGSGAGGPEKESRLATSKPSKPQLGDAHQTDKEVEDDFQVQATPPHLKSSQTLSRDESCKVAEDETTEDEGAQSPTRSPAKANVHPGRVILDEPVAASPLDQDGSETETESETGAVSKPSASASPSRPSAPQAEATSKSEGLGRIGGGRKPASSQAKAQHTENTSPGKQTRQRLGQVGKKPAEDVAGHEERDTRGRAEARQVLEARPRESSEDRANRKRSELQAELERKAAAGPAKKKRRF